MYSAGGGNQSAWPWGFCLTTEKPHKVPVASYAGWPLASARRHNVTHCSIMQNHNYEYDYWFDIKSYVLA